MAAYITVGAKTTHGGTVISGSPHTTHNGIPVARKGDKVSCKKCKKIVTIATGDPSFIIDGSPIARAGDVTTCGSKLIAIQRSFALSDFEVGSIEPAEQYVATYGDVNQGSDSEGYFTIEEVYLNNYLFAPFGLKARNNSGSGGRWGHYDDPDEYDKIFIKVKIKDGSFKDFNLDVEGVSQPSVLKSGTFKEGDIVILEWDGFIGDLYSSSDLVAGVDLKVYATDLSDNSIVTESKKIQFKYKDKDWLDIIINRDSKLIVVKLRVNISNLDWNMLLPRVVSSQSILKYGPLITKKDMHKYLNNNEIESLVKQSISRYWSRNHNTITSKPLDIDIDGDKYQVTSKCEITNNNSMPKINIIFSTNREPARSRNWEASRIVHYNAGYQLLTNKHGNKVWRVRQKRDANVIFKRVFAHEIGHDLLLDNGGQDYSKTHKGSSHLRQSPNGSHTFTGTEYDLMKYGEGKNPSDYLDKVVASEEDVLGLIANAKLSLNKSNEEWK